MAVDASELRALIADLSSAPKLVRSEARAVVSKAALNIKDQMRDDAAESVHFKQLAGAINYDIRGRGDTIEAEIGPAAKGAGLIAGIAYFGGSPWSGRKKPGRGWQQGPGGGGTVADPQGALDAEAPNVEKYLDALVAKALG